MEVCLVFSYNFKCIIYKHNLLLQKLLCLYTHTYIFLCSINIIQVDVKKSGYIDRCRARRSLSLSLF